MNTWRKWHKWLGIVIGLQILLWISGGVVMSVIPIDIVRGNHLVSELHTVSESPGGVARLENMAKWKSVTWILRGQAPHLLAVDWNDKRHVFDPYSGQALTRLTDEEISDIAINRYQGEGSLVSVALLDTLPDEVSFLPAPVFQAQFDDWINTHLYLDPITGSVLRVRSDIWRLYDVFWMLHIMDYDARSDFNNPLLITAAILALTMVFTGFAMTYFVWLRPRARKLLYHIRKR